MKLLVQVEGSGFYYSRVSSEEEEEEEEETPGAIKNSSEVNCYDKQRL